MPKYKIDYTGIQIPDIESIKRTSQQFTDWRRSMGFQTEKEKNALLQSKMQDAQQRFNKQDLWNSEDPYEIYNTYQTDPKKQQDFEQQGVKTAGLLSTIPLTIASAGTMGWIPELATTTAGLVGGLGGYKLGEYIDNKYDTKWASPTLGFIGGMLGGVSGYKGLVNATAKGWNPIRNNASKTLYGKQFIGDVLASGFNKNIKANNAIQQIKLTKNLYTDGSMPTTQPSTAPWNIVDIERRQQIERHNAFARKYNEGFGDGLLPYEIVPDDITDEALNEATKNMLRQHNTFYRGVTYSPEIEQLAKSKNISLDEALKIAAHRPKTYNGYTWVSPYLSAGYGGNRGHIPGVSGVARLERPYRLGPDRTKWFDEADFNLGVRTDQGDAEIFNPWIEKPGSTIGSELLGRRFIFRDWVSDYPLLSYGSRKR